MILVKRILEAEGYQLIEAADGLSGIKKAQSERPDLILMDLQMPDLDGYDAASRIKSINGLEHIPIIALTAKTTKQDREKALAIGCDGYIAKPFDVNTFPDLIKEYLIGKTEGIETDKKTKYLEEYSRDLAEKLEENITVSKKSLRELFAMAKLTNILNNPLESDKILQSATEHVKKVLEITECTIYRFNKSSRKLYPWNCCGGNEPNETNNKTDCCLIHNELSVYEKKISQKTLDTASPLMVFDNPKNKDQGEAPKNSSIICSPLKIRGEIIGILLAKSEEPQKTFNSEDFNLANIMANQIAVALHNCDLYDKVKNSKDYLEQKVQERTKELQILLDAGKSASSSLKLKEVLSVFCDKLVQLIPNTCCRIALLDKDRENLTIELAWPVRKLSWNHKTGQVIPLLEHPWLKHLIDSKKTIVFQNKNNRHELSDKEKEIIFNGKFQSCLLIPLTVNGNKIGLAMLHEMRSWNRWPFDAHRIKLCKALTNQMSTYINNAQLYEASQDLFLNTIQALGAAVDQRDTYTRDHSVQVKNYAVMIAKEMRLDEQFIEELRNAALLHDIGKIGISDDVLLKPNKLNPREFEIIQTHPFRSAKILSSIKEFKHIIPMVLYHHERYDGKGYNESLKGKSIPLGARILTVADSYDAMTSNRIYKHSISPEQAI